MGARSGGGASGGMGRGGGSAPFPGAVKAKDVRVGDTFIHPKVNKKINVVGIHKEKGTLHIKYQLEKSFTTHIKAFGAKDFFHLKPA